MAVADVALPSRALEPVGTLHGRRARRFPGRSLCARLGSLLALMALLAGCAAPPVLTGRRDAPVSRTAFYFDTVIQIQLYGLEDKKAEALLDDCMAMAARYDTELFSAHAEGSQIWALNQTDRPEAIRQLETDPAVAELLALGLAWQDRTDGAFSPTLGSLIRLWNITGNPPGPVPSPEEVQEALSHTDPAAVHITRDGATVPPRDGSASGGDDAISAAPLVTIDDPMLQIDLGGIAKGYIADQMKAYLVGQGVRSGIINLGGNVLTIGAKPDGTAFSVGIQDPNLPSAKGTVLTIPVVDQSVVTSGIYERYFEEKGVRYHHVLDPATGYPADSGLISVSILSSESSAGDALATACLVLGQEKGQALIESLPGIEAYFISSDGQTTATEGWPA